MIINRRGDVVRETILFEEVGSHLWENVTDKEIQDAIALLCKHLNVQIVRTNATDDGRYELQLRKTAP